MNGERKPVTSTGNGDGRRQQVVVSISPLRIGNDERSARTGDKQRTSGRFRSKEFVKGTR
jgi:hypothetical protein